MCWVVYKDGSLSTLIQLFINDLFQYDPRTQRMFLKKFRDENLTEKDFYVGNTVVIVSRQLKITGIERPLL